MDTMGDVMGYDDDEDGEDMEDVEGYDVVGVRRARRAAAPKLLALPRKTNWRKQVLTNGINKPREGMELLTLDPQSNNGVFDSGNVGAIIKFIGECQRPFRAERLIAFVARVADADDGVPAGFILCTGIFVGTALQQLTLGEFNIEVFGPTAFGVRMQLAPAAPGVKITMSVRCTIAPTNDQAIQVSLQFMGRSLAA